MKASEDFSLHFELDYTYNILGVFMVYNIKFQKEKISSNLNKRGHIEQRELFRLFYRTEGL